MFSVHAFLSVTFADPVRWEIIPGDALRNDPAYALALVDLQDAARKNGMEILPGEPGRAAQQQRILVGNAGRNACVDAILHDQNASLKGVSSTQGFEMATLRRANGTTVLIIAGGDIAGDIYGLYWLWDRIRVCKTIPELNVVRAPVLSIRAGGGSDEASLHEALRYTVNWAVGLDANTLVPWEQEPLRSANIANREAAKALIGTAHGLHMKYLASVDEFSYHPEDLNRFVASPRPDDPNLWRMLQDKYRRLFNALPELDGVRVRTGELTRVSEPLVPYDVMHEPHDVSGWPLEKRYQVFLQAMHQVVVAEFGKLYYHRTWVTNTTEQHSDAEVYRRIFTDAVPVENLYVSPYLTLGDRWFYQPYNPTFNLTPHKMLVLLAAMNYHEAGGMHVFPTFPGLYFQEGFNRLWHGQNSNIAGAQFWSDTSNDWSSNALTAYTAFRMSWNPAEDPRVIAEDFAAIHFGKDAAELMGEVILLSGEAYKHGLYVKPVAESIRGNTLPHLRLTTFPVHGFPALDQGKGHIDWLRERIYVPSKPEIPDAVAHLDRGLALAVRMVELGEKALPHFDNPKTAAQVMDALNLTRLLIQTNNAYIKTCYAYFDYSDASSPENREYLKEETNRLRETSEQFRKAPGFNYKPYGIEQLLGNANALVADRDIALKTLSKAPDALETAAIIRKRQEQDRDLLEQYADAAVKVLHWKGRVDGKDFLHIQEDTVTIEHIAADAIQDEQATFYASLPERNVTVFLNDVTSPEMHPFVLEQPTSKNAYTARVYLFDLPPGYGDWEFELYYVDQTRTGP